MFIWEAVVFLYTVKDDSDPNIDLDQTQHLLQTSEAMGAKVALFVGLLFYILTTFVFKVNIHLCISRVLSFS